MANEPTDRPSRIAATQNDEPPPDWPRLIEEYEAGPNRLREAVAGMAAEELRQRPVAGKWSTLEAVCHVSDCEQFFADRMKRTLAMDRPLLVGANGWQYPEAVRYHGRDLEEELALVALTRRQVARVLKHVPAEAWGRTAVHTEAGLVTLKGLLLHAVRHLTHHVAFIAEKRLALAAAARGEGRRGPGEPAVSVSAHEAARNGDFLVSTDPALLDVPLIHEFLSAHSYWAAGRPLEVVRRSLANSLCFGLYEGERQVGFARVVTDRATFAWLCDVFVLEGHRGRGLAKWLIGCVMSHTDLQGLRRVLLGTRDAHGLYERYGFTPLADPARFLEVFRPGVYEAGQPGGGDRPS
jgi:uncharacterized damage-inducible protein DinB/GNAT superfamily N-acetyltransferase